jgi:hypothetical protein
MTKIKACFNGCSFTAGDGFPVDQRDQFIYDRLVGNRFGLDRTNIAVPGSSNHLIFMRSATTILEKKYNIVFTQWSSLNRLWLFPGPDTKFNTQDALPTYQYRDIYLSQKEKTKFSDTLLILNHDYQNIIELVDYCSILDNLADKNGVAHVHINGLVPWTDDLDKPVLSNLAADLSDYTKSVLDFDNRDDQEISEFFQRLQSSFLKLDKSRWVNVFDSFKKNIIDKGPQGHHPGPNSHAMMAEKIADFLIQRKIA